MQAAFDPQTFLTIIAAILMIGIVGERMFERTGIPDVIWLIVVGFSLRQFTPWVDAKAMEHVAPYFGALTLVVVLFDGGSELNLKQLSRSAGRGSTLAVIGFLCSVAALAAASKFSFPWLHEYFAPGPDDVPIGPDNPALFPGEWGWTHAVMFGAILGGSSSAVIMPALSKSGLSQRVSNLVKLESAVSDVLCVVITFVCIEALKSGTGDVDATLAAKSFFAAISIGVAAGGVAGVLSVLVLRRLRHSAYTYPLTLSTLMLLYVLVENLGGNAALGILVAAIVLGNAPEVGKFVGLAHEAKLSDGVHTVHDQITFIVKSLFFTFLGMMISAPWILVGAGAVVAVILLLARVVAVWLSAFGSGLPGPARGLVTACMPRGMAAGVLAMMPMQAGIAGTERLPVIVFAAVVVSILLFAGGFPLFKGRVETEAEETAAEEQKEREVQAASPDVLKGNGDEHVADGLPDAVKKPGKAPGNGAAAGQEPPSDADGGNGGGSADGGPYGAF